MLKSVFRSAIFSIAISLVSNTFATDDNASKLPSTKLVISHDDVKKALSAPEKTTLLDLRRNADYDKDTLTIPMAQRFDPDKIAEWSASIPKDKEIVLFCAHGRSISDASVKYLTTNGFKARLIPGGFDAWKAAGGATIPKP
jgi:rhodanese-related sulfurtransferase